MILLLCLYGVRLSDGAALARDRIRGIEIFLCALKSGAPIWLPEYAEVRRALDCVPLPEGAAADCKYYCRTGRGSREGHIKTVDRTLQPSFARVALSMRHAHRFRHRLATGILAKGGTVEDAANILGDSPATLGSTI